MKFKNEGAYTRELVYRDKTDDRGDYLGVTIYDGKKKRVYIRVNGHEAVRFSRDKALKLAWAIIDELNPGLCV